jgi:hypothetical protein
MTNGQSASSSWSRVPFRTDDQIVISLSENYFHSYSCKVLSLTRGRVSNLQCNHVLVRVLIAGIKCETPVTIVTQVIKLHKKRIITELSELLVMLVQFRQSGHVSVHSVNTRSDNFVTIHFQTHVIPFFSSLYMRNPFLQFCCWVLIHPACVSSIDLFWSF